MADSMTMTERPPFSARVILRHPTAWRWISRQAPRRTRTPPSQPSPHASVSGSGSASVSKNSKRGNRLRSQNTSAEAGGRVPSPGACIEDYSRAANRQFIAAKHPFRRGSVLRVRFQRMGACRVCRPAGAGDPSERGSHGSRRGLSSFGPPGLKRPGRRFGAAVGPRREDSLHAALRSSYPGLRWNHAAG
jgi:hypothetical protein